MGWVQALIALFVAGVTVAFLGFLAACFEEWMMFKVLCGLMAFLIILVGTPFYVEGLWRCGCFKYFKCLDNFDGVFDDSERQSLVRQPVTPRPKQANLGPDIIQQTQQAVTDVKVFLMAVQAEQEANFIDMMRTQADMYEARFANLEDCDDV